MFMRSPTNRIKEVLAEKLFRKSKGVFFRYSEEFNARGDSGKTKELSLHLPDFSFNFPNFESLFDW